MNEQPEPPTTDDFAQAANMVTSVMGMLDSTHVVRQAASAYRDRLTSEEGFTEEVAEQMAIEFHRFIVAAFSQQALAQLAAHSKGRR